MGVEQFSLKSFYEIIDFHFFSWLIDNTVDVSCSELVRDRKVSTCNVFSFLLFDYYQFLSNCITLILSYLIVTLDPKGFNRKFTLIYLTCDSKKCFIYMTNVIASSTPTISASQLKSLY